MAHPLRSTGSIAVVLALALLHEGCTAKLPVSFVEPAGAQFAVRRTGFLAADHGGTVPFETALSGGAYKVEATLPGRAGEAGRTLRGILVVREVARWEGPPAPAEFRLMAWEFDAAAAGNEVHWSWNHAGRTDLQFKGSLGGFPLDDPEVLQWIAEGAASPPPQEAPPGRPFREAWAGDPPDEGSGLTWGKVGGVLLLTVLSLVIFIGGLILILRNQPPIGP